MPQSTIEPEQRTAARVAGFLYLLQMATAVFGESFVRGRLSAVFAYLPFRSRYVPRALAAWGIFASLALAIVTWGIIVWSRGYESRPSRSAGGRMRE